MTFPLDWDLWRAEWDEWKIAHAEDLRPTAYQFPADKNFMADEILGKWSINGRNVELSEVTFPDLRRDPVTGRLPMGDRRFIGITFGTAAGTDVPDNPVVESFEELEQELGI